MDVTLAFAMFFFFFTEAREFRETKKGDIFQELNKNGTYRGRLIMAGVFTVLFSLCCIFIDIFITLDTGAGRTIALALTLLCPFCNSLLRRKSIEIERVTRNRSIHEKTVVEFNVNFEKIIKVFWTYL